MTTPGPDDPDADAPDWWRRTRRFSRVPLILAVVIIALLIHAQQGNPPPTLTKSCTTPAFALSTTKVAVHKPVRWSATGPAGTVFQLAVGVDGFTAQGSRLVPQLPPGRTARDQQAASRETRLSSGCTASGTFGVIVPPGRYTVRMFTLVGAKTAPTATLAATRTLVVTAS